MDRTSSSSSSVGFMPCFAKIAASSSLSLAIDSTVGCNLVAYTCEGSFSPPCHRQNLLVEICRARKNIVNVNSDMNIPLCDCATCWPG